MLHTSTCKRGANQGGLPVAGGPCVRGQPCMCAHVCLRAHMAVHTYTRARERRHTHTHVTVHGCVHVLYNTQLLFHDIIMLHYHSMALRCIAQNEATRSLLNRRRTMHSHKHYMVWYKYHFSVLIHRVALYNIASCYILKKHQAVLQLASTTHAAMYIPPSVHHVGALYHTTWSHSLPQKRHIATNKKNCSLAGPRKKIHILCCNV